MSLAVENLSQHEGNDPTLRSIVENVSFTWTSPGIHVIMGSSGCGKSTLLKTIGGIWRPFSGQVWINGLPVWSQNKRESKRALEQLGFAFQNNALFNSLRVLENLSFPYQTRRPGELTNQKLVAKCQEWLNRVGLQGCELLYPHELSGGMQKRLALARTLILEPQMIFLDDPTAGLDPITSKQIADLVLTLTKGKDNLMVVVTNDADRARGWGDNIHFINKKTLVSPGAHDHPRLCEVYL